MAKNISTSTPPVSALDEIEFTPFKLVEPYNLDIRLSSLYFRVTPILDEKRLFTRTVKFKNLFATNILTTPECPRFKSLLDNDFLYENRSFYHTAKTFLCQLSTDIVLTRSGYTELVRGDEGDGAISVGDIGIGAEGLWYGYPDARIRAKSNGTISETEVVSNDENESQGDTLSIEAKTTISDENLPQFIGVTILNSFTEHKLHSLLNPMVPAILINKEHFRIALYDCTTDLLLLSNAIQFVGSEAEEGWLVAWLTVNHRKFLNEVDCPNGWQCGFRQYAERNNMLEKFQNLDSKNVRWNFKLPIVTHSTAGTKSFHLNSKPPPAKKQKL